MSGFSKNNYINGDLLTVMRRQQSSKIIKKNKMNIFIALWGNKMLIYRNCIFEPIIVTFEHL